MIITVQGLAGLEKTDSDYSSLIFPAKEEWIGSGISQAFCRNLRIW